MQHCLEQDLNPRPTDRKPKCLTRCATAPPINIVKSDIDTCALGVVHNLHNTLGWVYSVMRDMLNVGLHSTSIVKKSSRSAAKLDYTRQYMRSTS